MDGIYKPVSLFDFFNYILDGREDALQPFIDLLDQERNELLETPLIDNKNPNLVAQRTILVVKMRTKIVLMKMMMKTPLKKK